MTIFGISNKEPILNNRRLTKKVNQGSKFQIKEENQQAALSENVSVINSINPFIILNESYSEEKEKELLKEQGGKLLESLKEIRLALLSNEFNEVHLVNLTESLSSIYSNFQTKEIKDLINEISVRAEVELAKLQKNLVKQNQYFSSLCK